MLYKGSAFNIKNMNESVDPNSVFIINDIDLLVPPTNIIVNKEDMYWNWKTLRSNASTKIASGHGFCQATVNIIFTPDLLLHLHRLIIQIKNSPFCFIENEFLRHSLVPTWEPNKLMAFCVSSFFVNSVQGLPGTFKVQLDLKWFNYEPYTTNFLYKKDFLTYPIKDGLKGGKYHLTIPTIIGPNLETGHVRLPLSDFDRKEFFSEYYPTLEQSSYESLLQENQKKKAPRTIMENFTGFIFDGMSLPSVILPSAPCYPFESNIYKRYINDLQMRALFDNFGIDFYREVSELYGVGTGSKPSPQQQSQISKLMSRITVGEQIIYSDRITNRNVISLHSLKSKAIDSVIKKMHQRHSLISLRYREFKRINWPSSIEKIKSKLFEKEFLSDLKFEVSTKKITTRMANLTLRKYYDDLSAGKKSGFKHNSKQDISLDGKDVSLTGHGQKIRSLGQSLSEEGKKGYLFSPVGSLKDLSVRGYCNSGFGWRTLYNKDGSIMQDRMHHGIDFRRGSLGPHLTISEIQDVLNGKPTPSIPSDSVMIIRNDLQEILEVGNATSTVLDKGRQDALTALSGNISPIFAIDDGVVQNNVDINRRKNTEGKGLNVIIRHGSSSSSSSIQSEYMHMAYTMKRIVRGAKVKKGEIIGFNGNSGSSTGPHLHFEIKSTVQGEFSNKVIPPYPMLMHNFTGVIEEPGPPVPGETAVLGETEEAQEINREVREQLKKDAPFKGLTKNESKAFDVFMAIYRDMMSAGYFPYERGGDNFRFFEKVHTITLDNVLNLIDILEEQSDYTNEEEEAEVLTSLKQSILDSTKLLKRDASLVNMENLSREIIQKHGAVKLTNNFLVTGVSAGFSNIIASIPILDYEFPTTQHLGQMEPFFNFEIQFIADKENPTGLPLEGQMLNEVFQELQENARDFREAPDASAFALDTFMTRLLGSYNVDDLKFYEEMDKMESLSRFVLNRSSIETVEGFPGRSLMALEITQTNPFYAERIEASKTVEETIIETSYKDILKKLYALELSDHGKKAVFLDFLNDYQLTNSAPSAALSEEIWTLGREDGSGKDLIPSEVYYTPNLRMKGNYHLLIDEQLIKPKFKSIGSFENQYYSQLGLMHENTNTEVQIYTVEEALSKSFNLYEGMYGLDEEVEDMADLSSKPDTDDFSDQPLSIIGNEEIETFYNRHPIYRGVKEGTGEGTIADLKFLYSKLLETMSCYRFSVTEPEAGGVAFGTINDQLYDILHWTQQKATSLDEFSGKTPPPHYPSMWRNFILYTVLFLRKTIDDKMPDPLDGGLGWTKEQLENYLYSIDYGRLYEGIETAGMDEAYKNAKEIVLTYDGMLDFQNDSDPLDGSTHFVQIYKQRELEWIPRTENGIYAIYLGHRFKIKASENYVVADGGDPADVSQAQFVYWYEKAVDAHVANMDQDLARGFKDFYLTNVKASAYSYSVNTGEYVPPSTDYLQFLGLENFVISVREEGEEIDYEVLDLEIFHLNLFDEMNKARSKAIEVLNAGVSVDTDGTEFYPLVDYRGNPVKLSKEVADEFTDEYLVFRFMAIQSHMNIIVAKAFRAAASTALDEIDLEEHGFNTGLNYNPNRWVEGDLSISKHNERYWTKVFMSDRFLCRKFSENINLERTMGDAFSMNGTAAWMTQAGMAVFAGDDDWSSGFSGSSLPQVLGQAALFKMNRNSIYLHYLNELEENAINVGKFDALINTTFRTFKPFFKMGFTIRSAKEKGAEGAMLAFSGLERSHSLFIEWMLEPRLINNVGLDITHGNAGSLSSYTEDAFLRFLSASFGTADDTLTLEGLEGVSRDDMSFGRIGTGAALTGAGLGAYDTTRVARGSGGFLAKANVIIGALLAAPQVMGTAATYGKNPLQYESVEYATDDDGNIIVENGRKQIAEPRYGIETLNKMLITSFLINSENSATYDYYKGRTDRFGNPRMTEKDYDKVIGGGYSPSERAKHIQNMKDWYGTYEWTNEFETGDVRNDISVKKIVQLENYIDYDQEIAKLEVIRSRLKTIVEAVLSNREICYALDIPFAVRGTDSGTYSMAKSFGGTCYPDINLPNHPFYQENNIEMNPDFYMWNIYDDGGRKLSKNLLNELEYQSSLLLESAYSHQNKMVEGMTVNGGINFTESDGQSKNILELDNNQLKITPEAGDYIPLPKEVSKDSLGRYKVVYGYQGSTKTPFFVSNEEQVVSLSDDHTKELVRQLKESTGKSNYTFSQGSTSLTCDTKELVEQERYRIYKYLVFTNKKAAPSTITKSGFTKFNDWATTVPASINDRAFYGMGAIGEYLLGIDGINDGSLGDGNPGLVSASDAYKAFGKVPNITGIDRIPRLNSFDLTSTYIDEAPNDIRVSYAKLNERLNEVRGIESMFGNGAGYIGEIIEGKGTETTEEIAAMVEDIQIRSMGAQDSFTQAFDLNGLKSLAKASSIDLFSEKRKMGQAYPTFKLFFIEEDEFESRFLNLDDFYSFNGVKSFTITRNRENAADTAVISLQNVAGTLDGTRKGAIVDLDYFSKKRSKRAKELKREKEGKIILNKGDNFESNSELDQPFDAVVLRPGMNIQLRAGYSNNPDLLEVLISGRVTDLSITGTDSYEIVVQSFGVELMAQTKRSMEAIEENKVQVNKYYTTHQLLGAMMIEPELKHFGRWEKGRFFQYGEAQDSSLDFFAYKDAIKPRSWRAMDTVFNNYMSYTIGIGVVAIATRRINVAGLTRGLNMSAGPAGNAIKAIFAAPFNVRWFGGMLTYAAYGLGRGISASTFAGRQLLRRTMTGISGQVRSAKDLPSTLIKNGCDAPLVNSSRALINSSDEIINTVVGTSRSFLRPGKIFGRGWNWVTGFFRKGASGVGYTDEAFNALTPNIKNQLLAIKSLLSSGANYGTNTSAKILLQIDDLLAAAKNGSIGGAEFAKKAAQIATATENLALFMVSPAGPTKTIVMNGYSALTKTQMAKHALGELFIAGLSGPALAFKATLLTAIFASIKDNLYDSVYEHRDALRRWMTKELAYFKMRPSDDNLYPPSPAFYTHAMKVDEKTWWENLKYGMALSFTGVEGESFDELLERWKNENPLVHLKRVKLEDCEYFLENSTIWDIFYEMTLRHPGYIYSAVPYGNDFRYTMFFGIPSQRYWSKGVSNGYVQRMNTLRENLVEPPVDDVAVSNRMMALYGDKDFGKVFPKQLEAINLAGQLSQSRRDTQGRRERRKEYFESLLEKYKSNSAYIRILNEYGEKDNLNTVEGTADFLTGSDFSADGNRLSTKAFQTITRRMNLMGKARYGKLESELADTLEMLRTNLEGKKYDDVTEKKRSADVSGNPVGPENYVMLEGHLHEAYEDYTYVIDGEIGIFDHTKGEDNINFMKDLESLYVDDGTNWNSYFYGKTEERMGIRPEVQKEFESLRTEHFTERKRIILHSRVLKEYLTGLENRFVPFRRYHQIRSDRDIIRNNISLSSRRSVNSVNVYYKDLTGSKPATRSVFMKGSSAIPDSDLNTANIDRYTTNVRSRAMALRYGMGSLIYGMKEMYTGEILVLGNPRIKPWDICFVLDQYNKMTGPIEVKAVTHIFSFETGFVTEIVPNAMVFGNETSSLPVMEALKVYLSGSLNLELKGTGNHRKEDIIEDRGENVFLSKIEKAGDGVNEEISLEKIRKGYDQNEREVNDMLSQKRVGTFAQKMGMVGNYRFNGYSMDYESSSFMRNRFEKLVEDGLIKYDKYGKAQFDLNSLIESNTNGELKLFGGEDVDVQTIANKAESLFETAATATLAYHYFKNPSDHLFKGGGFTTGSDLASVGSLFTGAMGTIFAFRGNMRLGIPMGLASLALYGLGSVGHARNMKNSLMDKFSASYLIGAPIIFSRLTQEDAVTLIPLVKDGRPLSTTTSNRDPTAAFKNIFGNMLNTVQQTLLGTMDNYKEYESMGNDFWKHLRTANAEFVDSASYNHFRNSGSLYKLLEE